MVKYLSVDKFLELVDDFSMVGEIRRLKDNEVNEIFAILDRNNTEIEKQVGIFIENYMSKIKTTINFSPVEVGDIIIIKKEDKHYITVIEEVVSNETTVK